MPLLPFTRPPIETKACLPNPHWKEKCYFCLWNQKTFQKIWQFSAPEFTFDHDFLNKEVLKFGKMKLLKAVFWWKSTHKPHFHGNLSTHKIPQVWKSGMHIRTRKKLEHPVSPSWGPTIIIYFEHAYCIVPSTLILHFRHCIRSVQITTNTLILIVSTSASLRQINLPDQKLSVMVSDSSFPW